ncbi:protein kinase domain-containing protein [Sorangium cellulosum]|uniref:Protein kinase domain-containing protein n=1 Tax=Sorangium cellulosum TaxID=56 RepID=A0A150Q525_SORCE|nr:hypothetical protein [Sorangium cellulosum]KYF63079.1 hypothetical protein BE15_12165 [Sorangium cellulosum]
MTFGTAGVLEGVHAAGAMHKDVKPQNILVDEGWAEVVLVDFGIASELAQEATEASLPDALGVMLFEVLSGRRPFLDKDPLALVHAHLAKAPPALESLVEGVPAVVARPSSAASRSTPSSGTRRPACSWWTTTPTTAPLCAICWRRSAFRTSRRRAARRRSGWRPSALRR